MSWYRSRHIHHQDRWVTLFAFNYIAVFMSVKLSAQSTFSSRGNLNRSKHAYIPLWFILLIIAHQSCVCVYQHADLMNGFALFQPHWGLWSSACFTSRRAAAFTAASSKPKYCQLFTNTSRILHYEKGNLNGFLHPAMTCLMMNVIFHPDFFKGLKPMDSNGLADPYIKLHLLPGASKVRS